MTLLASAIIDICAAAAALWMPSDGDKLQMREFESTSGELNALVAGEQWDLSSFMPGKEYDVICRTVGDSVAYEFFPDFRMDYLIGDSILRIAGTETTDTHRGLCDPLAVFPGQNEADTIAIEEHVSRRMSEYVLGEGTVRRTAMKAGKLILPDADTIAPVVMTVMMSDISYTAADRLWRKADSAGSEPVTRREIRWYSPDARYPVARAWICGDEARIIVCPPASQTQSDNTDGVSDPENRTRVSEDLRNLLNSEVDRSVLTMAEVTTSESGGYLNITINFSEGQGTLSYIFTDIIGHVYSSRSGLSYSASEQTDIKINRRGLPPGEYLLHLRSDNAVRNEKIILH